ncbi:MAG: hypothetical protein J6B34_03375 [Clostridia bacterium]|nr:hypothetical protein [Clostridia bacterium]
MALDNKYFSYCEELGLMDENYTHQEALDSIIKEIRNTRQADPGFVNLVSRLTLSSPEVSIRSCVLYRYNANIDYVVNGVIKNTNISRFGHSGVHDSIHITDYKGKGNYRVLRSAAEVPYSIFNSKNLFTYDQMKSALTEAISDNLPKNYTSYKSNSWSVSAYIVPVLVVIVKYNNKEYQMYYNLQNGYYHWEWPNDPKLLKKGKDAKRYVGLIRFACVALSIIGAILAITAGSGGGIAVGIIGAIINIIIMNKSKKAPKFYQDKFLKNPNKSVGSCLPETIPQVILAVFVFILSAFVIK